MVPLHDAKHEETATESNIWILASDGDVQGVRTLLEQQPNLVNEQDEVGYSILHAATAYSHVDLVEFLLSQPDINVNIQDEDGDTPLHAVEEIPIAQRLVDAGADIRALNHDGWYPAEVAYREGHVDVAEWLKALAPDAFNLEKVEASLEVVGDEDEMERLRYLIDQHGGLDGMDEDQLRLLVTEMVETELQGMYGQGEDRVDEDPTEEAAEKEDPSQ